MISLNELENLIEKTDLTLEPTIDNSNTHFRIGTNYYNPTDTLLMRKSESN